MWVREHCTVTFKLEENIKSRGVSSTLLCDPSMCASSCHSPQKVPAKISPPHAAWRGLDWAGLGWAGLGWAGETCGESSLASQRGRLLAGTLYCDAGI